MKKLCVLSLISSLTSVCWAQVTFNPILLPLDDASHHLEYPLSPSERTAEQLPQFTEWWYFNGKFTGTSKGVDTNFGYYLSLNYVSLDFSKSSPDEKNKQIRNLKEKLKEKLKENFPNLEELAQASQTTMTLPFLMFQFVNLDTNEVLSNTYYYLMSNNAFQRAFTPKSSFGTLNNNISDPLTNSSISLKRVDKENEHYIRIDMKGKAKNEQNKKKTIHFEADLVFDPGSFQQFLPVANKDGYAEATYSSNAKSGLIPYTYYYSIPRMQTKGEIQIGNATYKIKGNSWYDRQWGDFLVTPWQSLVGPWFWQSQRINATEKETNVTHTLDINLAVINPGKQENESKIATILIDNDYNNVIYTKNFTIQPYCATYSTYPVKYMLSIPEIALETSVNISVKGQTSGTISEAISNITGDFRGISIDGANSFGYSESTQTYQVSSDGPCYSSP